MKAQTMSAETTAAGILAAKYGVFSKVAALLTAGAVGAVLIAAFDPAEAVPDPKARRKLILVQVVTAALVAGMVGPVVVSWLGKPTGFLPVSAGDALGWIELAMPVGLLLGGLSWGLIGALVKLRKLIADRAAQVVADRVGLGEGKSE